MLGFAKLNSNGCCTKPLNEWWAQNCTNKTAHTSQPEHAEYAGWSCYICNGPCRTPNSELPRCGYSHPDYIGVWCQLHRDHLCTHAFIVRWGVGWDSPTNSRMSGRNA